VVEKGCVSSGNRHSLEADRQNTSFDSYREAVYPRAASKRTFTSSFSSLFTSCAGGRRGREKSKKSSPISSDGSFQAMIHADDKMPANVRHESDESSGLGSSFRTTSEKEDQIAPRTSGEHYLLRLVRFACGYDIF